MGGANLTTQPGPHARSRSLHPRLTVALAREADRTRVATGLETTVVRADDLRLAAEALAGQRSAERASVRSRLDAVAARALHDLETARSQRDHLDSSRTGLLDGARWALELQAELPALHAVSEAARAVLETRQHEQRNALQALERVLEQRAAATAAMEEADRELSELVGVGMDETGLRRELEASGQAVRAAQAEHAATVERVAAVQAEQAELERRIATLQSDAQAGPTGLVEPVLIDRVRGWLTSWIEESRRAGSDPQALALADAWTGLLADLAEVAPAAPPPSPTEVAAAEAALTEAGALLERIVAATTMLAPAIRAELDAAHDAVLAAEDRTERRIGAAAARKRLEQARAAERALLEQYGFASYLDVTLSGGRANEHGGDRLAAERAYLAALAQRDALLAVLETSPDLAYLQNERARLHAHTVELLGVEPGEAALHLLGAHPLLPRTVVDGLRTALADVGIEPVGVSLAEAAARWVDDQDAAAEARGREREHADQAVRHLEELTTRQAELSVVHQSAQQAEAHAAEQLELALRSVGAFEAELSMRIGEDAPRLQRFAAAEQLRTQVEALASTLARAEADARSALDRTAEQTAQAEVAVDRAAAVLTEHARKVRRLSAELPIDQRPEGDPLSALEVLAERLEAHATVLEPEISAAEAVATAAGQRLDEAMAVAQAASTGLEGALVEDVHDALAQLLDDRADQVVLLDEPFAGVGADVLTHLLEVVLERSAHGSLVFLTEDADVLSWAIELSADLAAVVPADSLVTAPDRTQPTDSDSAPAALGRAAHR